MSIDWKVKGNYLKFGIRTYVLPGSTIERKYEIVERVQKDDNHLQQLDGVNALPIAVSKSTKEKYLIVIKNYRPPIDKYCIEFPGGLIDKDESIEQACLRELEEETGYSGIILSDYKSSNLPVCAGTGSESTALIPVLINLDEYKKENKQVQQHLEEDEVIEPILIPLDHFVENIKDYYEKGFAIELQVYYYALSMIIKSDQTLF